MREKIKHSIMYFAMILISVPTCNIYQARTGTFNPVKQIAELRRDMAERQRRYSTLLGKIYGPYGYADTNKDGIVNRPEEEETWKKIGIENPEIEGYAAKKPRLDQLERMLAEYRLDEAVGHKNPGK